MDSQIDLTFVAMVLALEGASGTLSKLDYTNSEFKEIWESLDQFKAKVIDDKLWFKNSTKQLFCERKLAIPKVLVPELCVWAHKANGHPGSDRTLMFFLQNFMLILPDLNCWP